MVEFQGKQIVWIGERLTGFFQLKDLPNYRFLLCRHDRSTILTDEQIAYELDGRSMFPAITLFWADYIEPNGCWMAEMGDGTWDVQDYMNQVNAFDDLDEAMSVSKAADDRFHEIEHPPLVVEQDEEFTALEDVEMHEIGE